MEAERGGTTRRSEARRGEVGPERASQNEPSDVRARSQQRGGASLLLRNLADTWAWENDRDIFLPLFPSRGPSGPRIEMGCLLGATRNVDVLRTNQISKVINSSDLPRENNGMSIFESPIRKETCRCATKLLFGIIDKKRIEQVPLDASQRRKKRRPTKEETGER